MIGLVDILEDYEEGHLDTRETIELFAELIRMGPFGIKTRCSKLREDRV